jgi:cell wall-associated NlpC family hydrolase
MLVLTVMMVATASYALAAPSDATSPSVAATSTAKPSPKPEAPAQPAASTPKTDSSSSAIQTPETPEQKAFREELAKRQVRLKDLQAQLDALDRELEIATEEFNGAEDRLAVLNKKLEATEIDLKNSQAAYDQQTNDLKLRVLEMYRGNGMDAVDVILGSKSVTDFFSRLSFLGLIGQKDISLADELANQRDSIQQSYIDLKDAKLEAEQLDFNLKARRIEIELRIDERQKMLASAQSDLLDLLSTEQGRRQQEEAALVRGIMTGASGAGITVVPGTPVETALAYHGIPYLWGGETPAGMDCSGLVLYVFRQHGVLLPHYSGSQFLLGMAVIPADMQPGDVVFFGSPIHHVGIYLGNDYFIHAPKTGDYIKVSRLSDRHDLAGVRRYPWVKRTLPIQGVTSPASYPSIPLTR